MRYGESSAARGLEINVSAWFLSTCIHFRLSHFAYSIYLYFALCRRASCTTTWSCWPDPKARRSQCPMITDSMPQTVGVNNAIRKVLEWYSLAVVTILTIRKSCTNTTWPVETGQGHKRGIPSGRRIWRPSPTTLATSSHRTPRCTNSNMNELLDRSMSGRGT